MYLLHMQSTFSFSKHYPHIFVTSSQIFIFQVVSDGYAAHLQDLQLNRQVAPSTGNARLFLQKSSFILPGQKSKKSSLQRGHACSERVPAISVNGAGTTSVDAGVEGGFSNSSKVRGRSPRLVLRRAVDESA